MASSFALRLPRAAFARHACSRTGVAAPVAAVTGIPRDLKIDGATAALVQDKQDYVGAPCVMPPDGTHECGVIFDAEKWVDYKPNSNTLGFGE